MRDFPHSAASVTVAVVVWSILSIGPGWADEASTKAALPYQVREILERHCLNCHGNAAKGGINLLDHALLVEKRQVVRPRSPQTSELFDLVAGGSMPPGNRRKVSDEDRAILRSWIQEGAPSLPSNADQAYVLWSIAHDFRTQSDKDKPFVRYLSLNHLTQDQALLKQEREALRDMLHYLTKKGNPLPELQPIESTHSIYRINLQQLGWDQKPYPEGRLNLFDLILLEYPYGSLPIHSPFYPELSRFLLEIKQIRPISYVRADWLVRLVSREPLHPDFLHLLGKPPDSKPPQTVLSLSNLLALPDRDPKNGIAIVPLDGLSYDPKPNADIDFRSVVFEQRRNADPTAKETFAPGDRMALWIKTKRASVVEVIYTDKNGRKKIPNRKKYQVEAGEALPLGPIGMELEANEKQQSEEYTIYAYPRDDLNVTNADFPNGTLLKACSVHDRVVHPLYELRADGKEFKPLDAAKMVKMTITVKTKRN